MARNKSRTKRKTTKIRNNNRKVSKRRDNKRRISKRNLRQKGGLTINKPLLKDQIKFHLN